MHAPGMAVSDDTAILPAGKADVRSRMRPIASWLTGVRVTGSGSSRVRDGGADLVRAIRPIHSAARAGRRGRRVEVSRASTAMK